MPLDGWSLQNYRIDSRGHVAAVQFTKWDYGQSPYVEYWRWYDLGGAIVESGVNYDEPYVYPHNTLGLKLDSRGHVVAVLSYYGSGEPYHWYDLDGNDLGEGPEEFTQIAEIRADARGHVVAVYMPDPLNAWYDLDGEEIE